MRETFTAALQLPADHLDERGGGGEVAGGRGGEVAGGRGGEVAGGSWHTPSSFPPQLLSRSCGEKAFSTAARQKLGWQLWRKSFLHSCETKAGVGRTGNEANTTAHTLLCHKLRNCGFAKFMGT